MEWGLIFIVVLLCVLADREKRTARHPSLRERRWHTRLVEGQKYLAKGKFAEADESLNNALRIASRFGRKDRLTGVTHAQLAEVRIAEKDLERAEALLRTATAIFSRKSHPWGADTVQATHRLSFVLAERGKLDEAEAILTQLLPYRVSLNPDLEGLTLMHIGRVRFQKGDLKSAQEHLEQAARILDCHNSLAALRFEALQDLAVVCRMRGRLESAADCLRRAVAIQEDQLGPDDVARARTLRDLGIVLIADASYSQAEIALAESLRIFSNKLPGSVALSEALGWMVRLRWHQNAWLQMCEHTQQWLQLLAASQGQDRDQIAAHIAEHVHVLRRSGLQAEVDRIESVLASVSPQYLLPCRPDAQSPPWRWN